MYRFRVDRTVLLCSFARTASDDETGTRDWSINNIGRARASPEYPPNVWLVTGNHTLMVAVHAQLVRSSVSPELRSKYDWCYNRMSEGACSLAIARWERIEDSSPSVDLPDSGHYPATHQIRKATSTGIKCERTYSPVPPGGDPVGPTEPMRHNDAGNWDDGSSTYEGDPRGCNTNGHPYYVLPRDRWHGPHKGCHMHGSTSTFHEHGVGKHPAGSTGLNQLTRPG